MNMCGQQVTVVGLSPLPRLELSWNERNCEYYTSFNLHQGLLQVTVSENMSNKLVMEVEDKCC